MSDPLERLRSDVPDDFTSVDVDAIKTRARGIVRRRQVVLGSGAAVIALIAFIGIVVRPGADTTELTFGDSEVKTPVAIEQHTSAVKGETTADTSGKAGSAPAPAAPSREQASRSAGGSVAAVTVEDAPAAKLEATLSVKEGSVADRGAELTLKVCNPGSGSVSREFRSSQRYDFEISRNDEIVWRWSDGRSFAQVVGRETWKADECKTWTEKWNGMTSSGAPASSGRYDAVGVLSTTEPQRTKSVSFCLDLC